MALFVYKLREWPDPETRADYIGEHEPREGQAKRPDVHIATLHRDGSVSISRGVAFGTVAKVLVKFEELVLADEAKNGAPPVPT